MEIVVLGSGTSTGVPVIGCECAVCTSGAAGNIRTRASVLLRFDGKNILIDTATDLRQQSLANGVTHIDAVLFTHSHADHLHGIDELRTFNMHQEGAIPCYADFSTIERIKRVFEYIFTENEYDGWKPRLTVKVIKERIELFGLTVTPVPIEHGKAIITGYRINDVAYLTDCSGVPEASMELLKGLKVLILGALRMRPHPSHFTIEQALELAKKLVPERTLLTHLSHDVDYTTVSRELPPGVELACDGMVIDGG